MSRPADRTLEELEVILYRHRRNGMNGPGVTLSAARVEQLLTELAEMREWFRKREPRNQKIRKLYLMEARDAIRPALMQDADLAIRLGQNGYKGEHSELVTYADVIKSRIGEHYQLQIVENWPD